ncbi:MAG TPA: hypothetical protein VE619_02310 [Nitrososphaeraceae archaeon]|nr:hypothetical protein [Nitrososphaeraceae archaeon]
MVFIEDIGSIFDAPLDKVWKLGEAHIKEGNKIHPNTRNNKTEMVNDTTFINSWKEEDMSNGQTIKIKAKGTIYYPLGMAFDILEGPFSGSKFFNYYKPIDNNNKTSINVVGDFRSTTISNDEQLKLVVNSFLEKVYNEDVAYLAKMY